MMFSCPATYKYNLLGKNLIVKKVITCEDKLYVACVEKAEKKIGIYELHPNGIFSPITSFKTNYLHYNDIVYSKSENAWIVSSFNQSNDNCIEMISFDGEKKWIYCLNDAISNISYLTENSKQIILSTSKDNSPKVIVLDLNGNVCYEEMIQFPNFRVISDLREEFIIVSYLRPQDLSGATIAKVSNKFEVIWAKEIQSRTQIKATADKKNVYVLEFFLNKQRVVSYDITNGNEIFNFPINISSNDGTLIQLGAPIISDGNVFYFSFQSLYKGEAVNSGLLWVNNQGKTHLQKLEDFGTIAMELAIDKKQSVLVSIKPGNDGYTEVIEVLNSANTIE